MAVNTILLDFPIGTKPAFSGPSGLEIVEVMIVQSLENHFGPGTIGKVYGTRDLILLSGPRSSGITVRVYPDKGLVTVNLDYYLEEGEEPLLSYQDCKNLELAWSQETEARKSVKTLPRLLRGIPFDIYYPTTDERLVEYDIDEMVFDSRSPFQHVQVAHSKTFGNILVLDDDPNIGESDLVYTESLMGGGDEKYEGKEVLILGGGDGALLYELLKENPKKVTMLEIDGMVMRACKEHMRSICGTVLDTAIGHNYEIITGDCFPNMIDLRDRNVKFDYIFGDLTTLPISSESGKDCFDFVRKVLNLAFGLLKGGGKFMTHAPGTSGPQAAAALETLIREQFHLDYSLEVTKRTVLVPSYSEDWTFFKVQSVPTKSRGREHEKA